MPIEEQLFCAIDEIITYTKKKKRIVKEDGSIGKYAIGTTIWSLVFFDETKIKSVFTIAKEGSQTRKQFEEVLKILPKLIICSQTVQFGIKMQRYIY